MPTLLLRFGIWLDDNSTGPLELQGPLFHRWLPRGEEDANPVCKFYLPK